MAAKTCMHVPHRVSHSSTERIVTALRFFSWNESSPYYILCTYRVVIFVPHVGQVVSSLSPINGRHQNLISCRALLINLIKKRAAGHSRPQLCVRPVSQPLHPPPSPEVSPARFLLRNSLPPCLHNSRQDYQRLPVLHLLQKNQGEKNGHRFLFRKLHVRGVWSVGSVFASTTKVGPNRQLSPCSLDNPSLPRLIIVCTLRGS